MPKTIIGKLPPLKKSKKRHLSSSSDTTVSESIRPSPSSASTVSESIRPSPSSLSTVSEPIVLTEEEEEEDAANILDSLKNANLDDYKQTSKKRPKKGGYKYSKTKRNRSKSRISRRRTLSR